MHPRVTALIDDKTNDKADDDPDDQETSTREVNNLRINFAEGATSVKAEDSQVTSSNTTSTNERKEPHNMEELVAAVSKRYFAGKSSETTPERQVNMTWRQGRGGGTDRVSTPPESLERGMCIKIASGGAHGGGGVPWSPNKIVETRRLLRHISNFVFKGN